MTDTSSDARFDFGRIVGRVFALLGRNAVTFLLLGIVFVGVPQFAFTYLAAYFQQTNPSLTTVVLFGNAVLTLVTTLTVQGALTRASIDDLSGKGVNFGAAIGDGFRFILPLFAMGILLGLG